MNRLYVYRLVTNSGFAPCSQDGLFSLACCKPMIRRTVGRMLIAGEANAVWLLGIGGSGLKKGEANRWLYAAKITQAVPFSEYFTDPKYQDRTDCIYRIENLEACACGDQSLLRYAHNGKKDGDIIHHPDPNQWNRDWGVTGTGRSNECYALLSTHFRWFSEVEAHLMMPKYPAYACNGRGHRVYEATNEFIATLDSLIAGENGTKHERAETDEDHSIEEGLRFRERRHAQPHC